MTTARVYAPGSIGNVGPGLDILGLALRGAGDTVTIVATRSGRVEVADPGHPSLPAKASRNASALAASAVLRLAGARPSLGLRIWVEKGLPLSGGQGGSAASAVAGAVATNRLLGSPLGPAELMSAALSSEAKLAGRHLDNIAPSLLGGLVLVRSMKPLEVIRLEPPSSLWVVLAKPDYQLRTKQGRAALPARLPLADALHQAAQVAAMVAAACRGDVALFGRAIDDRIAEPARSPLLPGFALAKQAAVRAGALGCSISGSGPTLFALTARRKDAERVAQAVRRAYARANFETSIRITRPDDHGARLVR